MPVVRYQEFNAYLKRMDPDAFPPVVLVFGEEVLCKSVSELVLETLLPASERSLNYDPFDGSDDNIPDVLERVNTYPFLSGRKVVALHDARIFYSKQDNTALIQKLIQTYDDRQMEQAAKYFLSLLGLLGIGLEDVTARLGDETLNFRPDRLENEETVRKLLAYCLEKQLAVPAPQDDTALLDRALEKGFPKPNCLLITTGIVDKRRRLFKTIQEMGLVVDCSVPAGDRQADKMAQEKVLDERIGRILKQHGVRMEKSTVQLMVEMAGFDLRTLLTDLEKLIDYVGDRKIITAEDVGTVMKRTKKEPIYELTNAIAGKNLESALFSLGELLAANMYPLQILAAISNQVRKLLMVKNFIDSEHGRTWQADMPYSRFKTHVIAHMQSHDNLFLDRIGQWEEHDSDAAASLSKGKKAKKQAPTDLALVKNPNNAYPVYMMLVKAENFTQNDLLHAVSVLHRADVLLKSTGHHPRLILENVIFSICGKTGRMVTDSS